MDLQIRPLEGRFIRLEPFAPQLKEEVSAALDCDPEAWALLSSTSQGEAFDAGWDTSLEQLKTGDVISYAVRRLADGHIVGRSCYLNIRKADRGLEIGATFYRPDARGGPVNPEAKLLLLSHAFECGAMRVELRTDALNLRSQAAIAKLGAVREGVLRRHILTWTGRVRDTVVYAITDEDWPAVRARLEARLATFGSS
jgi:RimJ/RimL family protein N-acetyltransferase